MLNPNSIVVQNLMQNQNGFNPYNGYSPQQAQIQQPYYNQYGYQQPMQYNNYGYQQPVQYNNSYYQQQVNCQNMHGYNPVSANNVDDVYYVNTYDPMPKVVYNDSRGINSVRQLQQDVYVVGGNRSNISSNNLYNPTMFYGYNNPYLMKNRAEEERIRQREKAIQQGRIWRSIMPSDSEDSNFDIDIFVKRVESMYYQEPIPQDANEPISEKMMMLKMKNQRAAQLFERQEYMRQHNIHVLSEAEIFRNKLANYCNRIRSITGDNDYDMHTYFTEVYPLLKYDDLNWQLERQKRNLKNKFDHSNFKYTLDEMTKDKPDSYYYKLLESMSEHGVKITNGDGSIVMTPDQMEVRLPQNLLNKQKAYYEQRKKFYDTVFRKD